MESGREGVIPLDKERMERLNVYFNDINLRIDLAKKIEQLQSNWNSLREWLEEEKTRLARECSHTYEDGLGRTKLVNEVIFNELDNVLDKMNELEGVDNENNNV